MLVFFVIIFKVNSWTFWQVEYYGTQLTFPGLAIFQCFLLMASGNIDNELIREADFPKNINTSELNHYIFSTRDN